ncbi:electron transporter HydN [Sporomusaceae bacterium FL31]|nr:electron transporter HydN [Sporomusaceae bacterium FL31]GCE34422.1 electron transporter HydN [Sporomusaceae bacterium]
MNDFVIADPEKCIGCRTCEVACVMAHGNQSLESLTVETFSPRLKLVKTINISMPIQCRHCEDAPCARVCTEHAIQQSGSSVQVIAGKCVGCKACLMACPYGAIDLVIKRVTDGEHSTAVDAVKCDLCQSTQGEPACIKVCPTKALYLIDGAKIAERLQNKRKRAAGSAAGMPGSL